ncbi:DUF6773 family protein [uncultured Clostridium sp.]|uniref:DUF6773 family protein n=1 Tax=uncultured Clostridium sp. TaxID=59620 RepID=UPI00262B91E8|nr:DUF6773 family protein [uncultured Clostridium sp.]
MKKIIDERVINEKRKITNEAFSLVMVFLIGSILVQQYVFNAPFKEYIVEFICFFGALIYIMIKNTLVGNKLISENINKKKTIIVNSITTGGVISIITIYRMIDTTGITSEIIPTVITTFLVGALSSVIAFYAITKLNEHKVKKIEESYDEEDS